MQSPIVKPDGKLFPTESTHLRVFPTYANPYSWSWAVGKLTGEETPEETWQEFRAGNDGLSDAEWNAWGKESSEDYIMPIAAENIGVTLK